jgi:Sec-independent protein translocase protein TatA
MLWQMIVVVLVVASGYVVFGPNAMSEAVDDAQQLQGDGSDQESGDES